MNTEGQYYKKLYFNVSEVDFQILLPATLWDATTGAQH